MNFKKIVFALALVVSTTAFSQKWAENMGKKLATKLNTTLVTSSEELKLTEDQTSKIAAIYTNLMIIKSDAKTKMTKEGTFTKKAHWKATFPQQKEANVAIRALLTQPQKKAFNESLQKKKK
ncbi:hypothetical protein [Wenyingzhuangia sp. IMCC45574]